MALTDKLSAIGNAIRAKTGGTELLTLDAMPNEIASIETGGGGEIQPMVLTGDQNYACSGSIAANYIKLYGNTISTKDLANTSYMFYNYQNERIPFELNYRLEISSITSQMFNQAKNLTQLPAINNLRVYDLTYFCNGCYRLREIPEDFFDSWDFIALTTATNAYAGNCSSMFSYCYSLRSLPLKIFKYMNPKITTNSYKYFYYGFNCCYVLDELVDLPLPYTATTNSGMFNHTFEKCYRLKKVTFALQEDGSPMVVNWKSQTIDLSNIGHEPATLQADSETWSETIIQQVCGNSEILKYNSGITADKIICNVATYALLKDDPDAFCMNSKTTNKGYYSRYNKTSAIETINSLPDTSAYLATAGGTNTIKFLGSSGASTDGGAINTMTEEEIAVATAKGWTVTFV